MPPTDLRVLVDALGVGASVALAVASVFLLVRSAARRGELERVVRIAAPVIAVGVVVLVVAGTWSPDRRQAGNVVTSDDMPDRASVGPRHASGLAPPAVASSGADVPTPAPTPSPSVFGTPVDPGDSAAPGDENPPDPAPTPDPSPNDDPSPSVDPSPSGEPSPSPTPIDGGPAAGTVDDLAGDVIDLLA